MTSRTLATLLVSAVLGLTIAGCSSADDSSSSADSDSGSFSSGGDAAAAAPSAAASAADGALAGEDAVAGTAESVAQVADPDRELISTGSVALRAKDVGQARADVQEVVDRYTGEVSEERTDTDEDGAVRRTHLVVRLPSGSFAEAMAALEDAADLVSSNTDTEDVTTQVIDNQVRLRVQKRSIERIEALLDRAESIRDIVSVEGQLSRRQADLDSLEQQQAYLADQTSLSTITVSVQRTPREAAVTEPDERRAGFVAGLDGGWHGLTTVAVGLATVAGALLPFGVVLLVLGVPTFLLVRRLRRRRPVVEPADPSSA